MIAEAKDRQLASREVIVRESMVEALRVEGLGRHLEDRYGAEVTQNHDWTGAGRGPRLWSLGFLLWAAGALDLRLVDAVVTRYRRSVELEPSELDRLEGAIRDRPVMLEAWAVCAGRRELAVALDRIERTGDLAASIAVVARRAFSGSDGVGVSPAGERSS